MRTFPTPKHSLAEDFPPEWTIHVYQGFRQGGVDGLMVAISAPDQQPPDPTQPGAVEVMVERFIGAEEFTNKEDFDNAVIAQANQMWRKAKRQYELDSWVKARGWEK